MCDHSSYLFLTARCKGRNQRLHADGLFIGQQRSKEFLDLIIDMAEEADAARRELDE